MTELSPVRRDLFPPPVSSPVHKPVDKPSSSFDALDRVTATASSPLSPETLAAAKTAAMTAKIDAYFAAATAPYAVITKDGEKTTVNAAPQFRMVGGYNFHVASNGGCLDFTPLNQALGGKAKDLQGEVGRVLHGRGSPEDVAKLTRVLIEQGHLGPVVAKSAPAAIQALQWKFGLGIDCAGYTQRAFFAARGMSGTAKERAALGLAEKVTDESFAGLPTNKKWRSVPVASARAGDVMLLGAPKGEGVGHVVLVRANTLLGPADKAKMGIQTTGPVRMLEVDSSWGAGEKGIGGGVQRRVWLLDENAKTWSTWDPASKKATPTPDGPYDHPLTGIYRPKVES